MWFVKLCLAAFLLLVGVGVGLFFALGGLWSPMAFVLFAVVATIVWRVRHGGGRDRYYFLGFSAGLVVEVLLMSFVIQNQSMGMHRIMDGYDAPSSTQALLALVPLAVYLGCLSTWAFKQQAE